MESQTAWMYLSFERIAHFCGNIMIIFQESFHVRCSVDPNAPGLGPPPNWSTGHSHETMKSRSQTRVQHNPDKRRGILGRKFLYVTLSLGTRPGQCVQNVALGYGSLEMRRDYFANREVWHILQQAVIQQCIRYSHTPSNNDLFWRVTCPILRGGRYPIDASRRCVSRAQP